MVEIQFTGESLGPAPIIWEYNTVSGSVAGFFGPNVQPDQITEFLNQHGANGWELVNTVPVTWGHGSTSELLFLFKRPAQARSKRSRNE